VRSSIASAGSTASRAVVARLVLTESCEDIRDAIHRESNIKHWPRAWNVRLTHAANPDWRDLYEDLNA
jgi:putative endonuclease